MLMIIWLASLVRTGLYSSFTPTSSPRAKWEGIALGTRLPLVYQSYQKSPKSMNLDEILSLSVFLYLCTPFAYV